MSLNLPSFLSFQASSILAQLAQAYGFDLFDFQSNIYLRLEQKGYMPLVLERLEPHVISLSHYYQQNGDLMADPDLTFLVRPSVDNQTLLLFPLMYRLDGLGLYQELAFLNDQRDQILSFKSRSMADVASFCNQWAINIQAQQWFLPSGSNPQVSVTTS
ncbi:MAG: hypothetical protein KME09_07165 [Pleurocapsa minor HA4230-MV1]|jgi:hypothetical protein|nr:hypothetical protein [Pleurocapsa minor HA4230-MV1]